MAIPDSLVSFGSQEYTKKIQGNMPVVISAPHGGHLDPETIRNRNPKLNVTADSGTSLLGIAIVKQVFRETGKYPYFIQCRLHRRKLDVNRDIEEGTDGNENVEEIWHEYHRFVEECIEEALQKFGIVYYFDIHGHGHNLQLVELGYTISANILRKTDDELNSVAIMEKSSLYSHSLGNNIKHSELIRGSLSFGSILTNFGYDCVPSPNNPFPKLKQKYFSGGYSVKRHTANPNVIGIQVECPSNVRKGKIPRKKFAKSFALSVAEYTSNIQPLLSSQSE